MPMPKPSRPSAFRPLLIASAGLWLACGGGEADLTEPAVGSVEISTRTSGVEPDADGYAVTIDDGAARPIGVNGVLRVEDLARGSHTVTLTGAAANCTAEPPVAEVEVEAGATARVAFTVTCRATTGSIQLTASTGENPDPDGYVVLLDGAEAQPIAVNGSVTLGGVAAGPHLVGLGDVAAECRVDGDNPRGVSVVAGEAVALTIVVICAPTPSESGSLSVTTATTGSEPDPDGYMLVLDGGQGRPMGANASLTIDGIAAGTHTLLLDGVAPNCRVQQQNPRDVSVTSGETATTAFAVVCSATTGRLMVEIRGLPVGTAAAVSVAGPGGYAETVTETRTLEGLLPGEYTVTAGPVTSGALTYVSDPASRKRTVTAGETATAGFVYSAIAAPTYNLRIAGMYLTQSTQTLNGDVPLLAGRDAYLRVFVVANESGPGRPDVRVRLFNGESLLRTLTIPAPSSSTPIELDEGELARSWNLPVPGNLVQPGLQMVAEVDPANAVEETDDTDNQYPASGSRQPVEVVTATPLRIRLVPIRQSVNGLEGGVSEANKNQYLDLARRALPLPGYNADVRATYTTSAPALDPTDANGSWNAILNELEALRVAEGTDRHYYGVVRLGYGSGINGIAFLGLPTAMGFDQPLDAPRVLAHELGHTWLRFHAACGNPGGLDPEFPYPAGQIGVYGLDVAVAAVKDRVLPDLMGYCRDAWISDYTYRAILDYRASEAAAYRSAGPPEPALLVWGRIAGGRAVLEPAFRLTTRPSMPARGGAHAVEGRGSDGASLFRFSFDPVAVADDPGGARQFAFAVPLDDARAARLADLRLTGPGVAAAAVASAAAVRGGPPPPDGLEARGAGGQVSLRWNGAAYPMLMVRDPRTGEILSLARRGTVEIRSEAGTLEAILSDGVRSRRTTLRVSGR